MLYWILACAPPALVQIEAGAGVACTRDERGAVRCYATASEPAEWPFLTGMEGRVEGEYTAMYLSSACCDAEAEEGFYSDLCLLDETGKLTCRDTRDGKDQGKNINDVHNSFFNKRFKYIDMIGQGEESVACGFDIDDKISCSFYVTWNRANELSDNDIFEKNSMKIEMVNGSTVMVLLDNGVVLDANHTGRVYTPERSDYVDIHSGFEFKYAINGDGNIDYWSISRHFPVNGQHQYVLSVPAVYACGGAELYVLQEDGQVYSPSLDQAFLAGETMQSLSCGGGDLLCGLNLAGEALCESGGEVVRIGG